MNIDTIYRKLGEFVVSFQGLENRFREIAWLILDPERRQWPPLALRNETNHDLLVKVEEIYLKLIDQLSPDDAAERKDSFRRLVADSHEMRQFRNRLAHSAYIELKAGGEVIGLLRSDPRLEEDAETGALKGDQEELTEQSFEDGMKELERIAWDLNMHYVQLIHWAPFERKSRCRVIGWTRRGRQRISRIVRIKR